MTICQLGGSKLAALKFVCLANRDFWSWVSLWKRRYHSFMNWWREDDLLYPFAK